MTHSPRADASQNSVAKMLYDAKREAGDQAVRAGEAKNYALMRKWQALAMDIDALAFRTIDLTKELPGA